MKTKNPKLENSDQVVWSLEDDLSGQFKSYTCSFCKKGFSNAQALGGHMNIHRKDRAKLRESSEENMLSLDIVKNTSQVSEIILESSEEKSCSSLKRPCKLSKEDDIGASACPRGKEATEELKQLPFFVASDHDIRTSGDDEEESLMLNHGSSSDQMELLDLELRLGPHQGTSRKNNPSKRGY